MLLQQCGLLYQLPLLGAGVCASGVARVGRRGRRGWSHNPEGAPCAQKCVCVCACLGISLCVRARVTCMKRKGEALPGAQRMYASVPASSVRCSGRRLKRGHAPCWPLHSCLHYCWTNTSLVGGCCGEWWRHSEGSWAQDGRSQSGDRGDSGGCRRRLSSTAGWAVCLQSCRAGRLSRELFGGVHAWPRPLCALFEWC